MRRFWFSTEFWCTVFVACFMYLLAGKVPILYAVIAVSVLGNSYILGRTLWKKNRGQFYSATKSSEFYVLIALHIGVYLAWKFAGLLPLHALIAITANQSIYNILRGITKGLGVKTQMIIG